MGYRNVYHQDGKEPNFCYRTGLTVYEESFTRGTLMARGWNAAGYPLNVLSNCPTRLHPDRFVEPQAFRLTVDGESCDRGLEYKGFACFEEDEEHTHAVVTLRCEDKRVTVRVHTLLDGTSLFSRWLEIKNEGDAAAAISDLSVMRGGVETMDQLSVISAGRKPDEFYRLGYFDAECWGKEGDFTWHAVTPDTHTFGGRFVRERFRHPLFFLENRLKGTILVGQLAYSGGYRFSFDYSAHPEYDNTAISMDLALDSMPPLMVLKAGETLTTPAMHIGMVAGDLDAAVNAMHDHTRKSVLNLPGIHNPCLVGAGMGAEHDMNVDTTKQFMEQMARAGAELFIVDAGWYCPPGKETQWYDYEGLWRPDPDRYPNGVKEIEDYCRKLGMKFGFWMEPESVGKYSGVHEKHPDWFVTRWDGTKNDRYFDFSNPEAVAWVEEQVSHVIEDYHLDLFRIDYNVSGRDFFHVGHTDGRRECRSLRHIQGIYGMYRRLKEKYPDVVFENCAGGGGRTDLGMMACVNHSWVSDKQVPPRSVEITNGMTMALPPDRVDRLVAGMGCHEYGSLDFHMRNAMFTHFSLNVFAPKDAEMNDDVFDFIRHSTDLYKSFVRPYLCDARIYHHTPDMNAIRENGKVVLELAAKDASRDMIGFFSLPGFDGKSVTVVPKGIAMDRDYRVTYDNSGMSVVRSGYDILTHGITARIDASLMSELVTLQCV